MLYGNPTPGLITTTGGYIYPTAGSAGFIQQTSGIPYFGGVPQVGNIPSFMRDWNMRDMLVTKIREGRMNMMRTMFSYARARGAWVVNDLKPTFKLDYKPIPRFYLKIKTNQGGTAGSQYTKSTFVLANPKDAKRLQVNDILTLNFAFVPPDTDANSSLLDYVESPVSSGIFVAKRSPTVPVQERCLVYEVDYLAGTVTVIRNMGNDTRTASRTGVAVTVQTNATTDPGASVINAADAFFIRTGNTLSAGTDDQITYNRTPTWDYNTSQYVMRKWSSQDIESNIFKAFPGFENTMQKNRVDTLEDFFEELEFMYLYGVRNEEYDSAGRWKGTMGGFFEFVPLSNYVEMEEPDYTDATKMGDFTIPRLNKMLVDKFYYGSQEKILVCGERWHTAFSIMINKMTQNIPNIVDRWDVRGYAFQCSNGGRLFVVPSDTLSLNGNNDIAALYDPETFQFGHLQNMDINVVDPLPTTNIHESEGEVYGVVTAKRTNPSANYVFVLKPNAGG
jgi:hypothetical protein